MTVPTRLTELAAEQRITPFLGAGFSIPSGVPNWSNLIKGLIDSTVSAQDADLLVRLEAATSLLDVSEMLDSLSITEHAILSHFREQLDNPRLRPNKYHDVLLDLNSDTIVTTNWDNLVEAKLDSMGVAKQVIYREQDVPFYDPTSRLQVLKIHGTIGDVSSLIYRKSQYTNYWKERQLLLSVLSTVAATRSLLFLGYGFGDPNFIEMLEMLKSRLRSSRPEHYAITYGRSDFDRLLKSLGVVPVQALGFEPEKRNFEESTLATLDVISGGAKSKATNNLTRAMMVNAEIHRVSKRRPPMAVLRMRGALGWLSNPVPDPDDPVYGSHRRDQEERRMTELVEAFLSEVPGSRVRCILHIDAAPLLSEYRAHHLRKRMTEILRVIIDHPGQIQIAHEALPSQLNQMIFDDAAALLGFRQKHLPGIQRVWFVRNKQAVRHDVEQFEADFQSIVEMNRNMASEIGIDLDTEDWQTQFITHLIQRQIADLDGKLGEHDVAPRVGESEQDVGKLYQVANACSYAVLKHAECGQTREDGTTPFGVHPLRVVDRLRNAGEREANVLTAAALHDVVEDCGVSPKELSDRFGSEVASLVKELTQDEDQSSEHYISQLAAASRNARAIKLADRLDNVTEMREMRLDAFGGVSTSEYLQESRAILEACGDANAELALALGAAIEQATEAAA